METARATGMKHKTEKSEQLLSKVPVFIVNLHTASSVHVPEAWVGSESSVEALALKRKLTQADHDRGHI